MEKSPEAFRTISEVADFLETPAHVLRFWESRFPQIRPVKRAGGRRYYRPSDVALLAGIKRLLHEDGLTIRGVQKILQEQGVKHVAGLIDEEAEESLAAEAETVATQAAKPIPLFPPPPEAGAASPAAADLSESAQELADGGDSAAADSISGASSDAPDSSAAPDPSARDLFSAARPAQPVAVDPVAPEPALPPAGPAFDGEVAAMEDQTDPSDTAPGHAVPAPSAPESNETAPETAVAEEAAVSDAALEVAMIPDPALSDPGTGTDPDTGIEPDADIAARLSGDEQTPSDSPAVTDTADSPVDPAATLPVGNGDATVADRPPRWLAAELRALRATALHGKADRAEAIAQRLRVLRGRLAPAGRAPLR
ncbi:MAG: MerR family transcriptional regulator [Pseudorhodobacter sp.]